MTIERLLLYKTAFSPLFGVYVSIDRVRLDTSGVPILHCSSSYNPDCILTNHLFREEELTNFCL